MQTVRIDRGATELPPELLHQEDLEALSLSSSDLTSLPVGHWPKLRRLDLTYTRLQELPDLSSLPALESLALDSEAIRSIPPQLAGLRLKRLDLCVHSVAGAEVLLTLPELEELHLLLHSGHHQRLPDAVYQLPGLRKLGIEVRSPSVRLRSMEGLEQAVSLEQLQLSVSPAELVHLPEGIGALKRLRRVGIRSRSLSTLPRGFAELSALEEFSGLELPFETFPTPLLGCSRLRTLILDRTPLTELPEDIGRWHQLKLLRITEHRLERLPDSLCELTELTTLAISSDPGFKGRPNPLATLPERLGDLRRLERLVLGGGALTEVPPSLGQLQHLERLDLGWNELATLPQALRTLSTRRLNLAHNRLTELPPCVPNMRGLEALDLSHNVFADDLSLRGLPQDVELSPPAIEPSLPPRPGAPEVPLTEDEQRLARGIVSKLQDDGTFEGWEVLLDRAQLFLFLATVDVPAIAAAGFDGMRRTFIADAHQGRGRVVDDLYRSVVVHGLGSDAPLVLGRALLAAYLAVDGDRSGPVVDALLQVLRQRREPWARVLATQAFSAAYLYGLGIPEALRGFLEALKAEPPVVAQALHNLSRVALPESAAAVGEAVAPLLAHPEPLVRARAAWVYAICSQAPPEARAAVLAPLLADGDPAVRRATAEALGTLEHPAAVAPLLTRVDDLQAGTAQLSVSLPWGEALELELGSDRPVCLAVFSALGRSTRALGSDAFKGKRRSALRDEAALREEAARARTWHREVGPRLGTDT